MNSFKYITIILFALAMLAGCGMRQRNNMGMSPAERAQLIIQGMNPQVAATATATSAMSTTGAVAPQPAPKPVVTRPVGQAYSVFETEIEASDTMSVKVSNPTKFLACLHSQQARGVPVLRPRVGYPQDVLPSMPNWRVSCTAVLMPNPGRYDRSAPEVWLATRKVGNVKLWATFYTWDVQDPQLVPEVTFAVDLTFPNTPGTNGYCMAGNRGCLWEILLQAASEESGRDWALAQNDPFHLFSRTL